MAVPVAGAPVQARSLLDRMRSRLLAAASPDGWVRPRLSSSRGALCPTGRDPSGRLRY